MSGLANANAAQLPYANGAFHCIVTSIPYWGLRAYADNPAQLWGGDCHCRHAFGSTGRTVRNPAKRDSNRVTGFGEGRGTPASRALTDFRVATGDVCRACGAWRGSYGLEPSLDLYLEHTLAVFREVWRVLRPDGTLWLNIGDCYATAPNGRSAAQTKASGQDDRTFRDKPFSTVGNGLKDKDLCLVPARVAIALQADGWWVRAENVWSKPNPLPESIRDRTTRTHEFVYMLTKAERYFYDQEAVKEPTTGQAHPRGGGRNPKAQAVPTGWDTRPGSHNGKAGRYPQSRQNESFATSTTEVVETRNMRSVWNIPTQPYEGSHFATFPEQLVERCVLAGTSAHGCCPKCGAPWVRVTSHVKGVPNPRGAQQRIDASGGRLNGGTRQATIGSAGHVGRKETIGWQSTCWCGVRDAVPCRVFDPFVGSGTVVQVARRLGRHGYGADLSLTYLRENALPRAMRRSTESSMLSLPLFSIGEQQELA